MKSEIEIIDDLGEWLCRDMELEVSKIRGGDKGIPSTAYMGKLTIIKEVGDRIKFYRDNVLEEQQ